MNEQAFLLLLRLSGELSLILLALLLLRPILRHLFGAACVYAAWLLAPLLLVVAQLPSSVPGEAMQVVVAQELPLVAHSHIAPTRDGAPVLATPLLLLWCAGAAACGALLVRRQKRFMRDLRPQADETWQSPVGTDPALVGLWPARLCLPQDFKERFSAEHQRLILAHEEVHRTRHDNAWNLLALAVCVLQWFNPLAWLAQRALRVDQELSCDAAVLQAEPEQAADYARALLNAQGPSNLALPWASWRSAHPLVKRISMLKTHAKARRRAGFLALVFMGLLSTGLVHALQSEPVAGTAIAGKPDVRLIVSMQYGEPRPGAERSQKWRSSKTLDLVQGQPSVMSVGVAGSAQRAEFTVTALPHGEGQWDVKIQLRRGEPWRTVATPRMILADGSPGTLDSTFDDGGELIAFVVPMSLRDGKPVAATPR